MAKNRIPVEIPADTNQAIRNVRKLTAEMEKVGRTGNKAGEETSKSMGAAAGAANKLGDAVKTAIGAWATWAAARRALELWRQEMEQIERTTRSTLRASRSLMALSAFRGARPATQAAVLRMAAEAGRPTDEVLRSYYTLAGGTAGMARSRQAGLMRQALMMGRTDLEAPLEPLVGLFSAIGTQQPKLTPQQIGNLVSQTIESAKATPGQMAAFLPRLLSAGSAAKMDPAMSMGLFAFATRQGGRTEVSATAARSAMLGLLAPTPERLKEMQPFGFPSQGGIMERVEWLRQRGAQLPSTLQAELGGREGIEAVAAIIAKPKEFQADVAAARRAQAAPYSLLEQRMQQVYSDMPAQRWLDVARSSEILAQIEHIRPETMRVPAIKAFREAYRRRQGMGPIARTYTRGFDLITQLVSGDLGEAPDPQQRALEELLDEGYAPTDLMALPIDVGGLGFRVRKQPYLDRFRGQLQERGAKPMQAPVVQNIGVQYQGTPAETTTNTATRTGE